MTDKYLEWTNGLKNQINQLKNELRNLEVQDKRAIIIEVQIKKKKFRYSPFYHLKCEDIELKSDFSFKALIELYKNEIKRLETLYEMSNEENYEELEK